MQTSYTSCTYFKITCCIFTFLSFRLYRTLNKTDIFMSFVTAVRHIKVQVHTDSVHLLIWKGAEKCCKWRTEAWDTWLVWKSAND